jgi:hypothetical protein
MDSTKVTRSQRKNKADLLLPTSFQTEPRRCGACGRLALFLIPILACSFVLAALFLLAYLPEVLITTTTISDCLAAYETKIEILALVYVGATLMSVSSVMRNIQINVYHRRQRSESTAMKVLNFIAAVSNIFAYVGFIILATFDVDGPDDVKRLHYVGAIMYFALAGLYALLHVYLLCKQAQYPMFCKIIFAMIAFALIVSSTMFGLKSREWIIFEWFAIVLDAIYVGLIGVLFLVDPVDDELRDFFCCSRGLRKK